LKKYTGTRLCLVIGLSLLTGPTKLIAGPASANIAIDSQQAEVGMNKALENIVDQYTAQKKHKEAIKKLDEEIQNDPNNVALLYKKAEIYADIEQYYKSRKLLKQIETLKPDNKAANKLVKIVDKKIKEMPHNEIGYDQDQAYITDLMAFWTYASLHYYRLTEYGSYGGRINYANRYGTNGAQYLIETYPKFNDNISASISVGYANQTQILYPNVQYRVEPFFDFSNGIEFSVGQSWQKYITFDNQKIITNTGTFGKYFKKDFIWYRPSFYSPTASMLNELSLRHFADKKNTYMTFKINAGRLPDIGDLPPLDKIVVLQQRGINIDGQYALTKTFFLKGGAGYTRQYYIDSKLLRRIIDASLGVVYQFA
jgi:YaiO family outer membrane protein